MVRSRMITCDPYHGFDFRAAYNHYVYCPACGVKNDGSPEKCFICDATLPSGVRSAAPDKQRGRASATKAAALPAGGYAAIGDRMLALILDRVLIVALLAIPWAFIASRSSADSRPGLRTVIVAGFVLLVAVLAYHIVLEAIFGATLGKGLLGLQVRNGSNEHRWMTSTIRNISRLLDAIFFYSLAFLVAVFTPRRQRLGDLFAGTTVIEQRVVWGARVALIFIWVALVAGSLWVALTLCPSCVPDRSRFSF